MRRAFCLCIFNFSVKIYKQAVIHSISSRPYGYKGGVGEPRWQGLRGTDLCVQSIYLSCHIPTRPDHGGSWFSGFFCYMTNS